MEDCTGLGLSRELGVVDLVAPVTEVAFGVDAMEDVRLAEPLAIAQAALDNDVCALLHGADRRGHELVRLLHRVDCAQVGDVMALRFQPVDVLIVARMRP